jgi:hypothetical protein
MADLESALEARLFAGVRRGGGACFKLLRRPGLPDRLVVLPPDGRMLLIELKTDTGRLSLVQKTMHEELRRIGVTVLVLTGRDGIDRWLTETFPATTYTTTSAPRSGT